MRIEKHLLSSSGIDIIDSLPSHRRMRQTDRVGVSNKRKFIYSSDYERNHKDDIIIDDVANKLINSFVGKHIDDFCNHLKFKLANRNIYDTVKIDSFLRNVGWYNRITLFTSSDYVYFKLNNAKDNERAKRIVNHFLYYTIDADGIIHVFDGRRRKPKKNRTLKKKIKAAFRRYIKESNANKAEIADQLLFFHNRKSFHTKMELSEGLVYSIKLTQP